MSAEPMSTAVGAASTVATPTAAVPNAPARSDGPPRRPAGHARRGGHDRAARASRPRGAVLVVAIALATAAAVGGGVAQATTAPALWSSVHDPVATRIASAQRTVDATREAIRSARAVLDSSTGRVLDEGPRDALAAGIATASTVLPAADRGVGRARSALRSAESVPLLLGWPLVGRDLAAAGAPIPAVDRLTRVPATLASLSAAVRAATDAWHAEQARAQAGLYTNVVHAVGWLPELDECAGSVDVTAHYGVPTIAEHWSCGGKRFPLAAGTLIRLTGVYSGVYRVEGVVAMLNAHHATTDDLPRGYELLYQTCQNGQSSTMSFIGLTRVGDLVSP